MLFVNLKLLNAIYRFNLYEKNFLSNSLAILVVITYNIIVTKQKVGRRCVCWHRIMKQ